MFFEQRIFDKEKRSATNPYRFLRVNLFIE
jgi:hypothetical protein